MLNLARLFSFTRALEDQLARQQQRHEEEIRRLREAFGEERVASRAETDRLCEDLDLERQERRYLRDRLLPRAGVPPIDEPSPGEAAQQQAQSAAAANRLTGGPRERAAQIGEKKRALQVKAVEAEVASFIEKRKQANGTNPEH